MSEVAREGGGMVVEGTGRKIRVLLVTSDRERCGIREYGRMLKEAVEGLGQVEVEEFAHPDPAAFFVRMEGSGHGRYDVVHINHHAALHAGWTADMVRSLKNLWGGGVVVTQHDTYEKAEIMWERGFTDFRGAADYLFVHEEVEGLADPGSKTRVMVLRQPVPYQGEFTAWPKHVVEAPHTLGLFGFDFPWKNFDMAVRAARKAGWAVHLWSPNITIERADELQALNPGMVTITIDYPAMESLVAEIQENCCATAFLYSCGNSGTSGAIRVGIATQRPVIALRGCRQFRDLEHAEDEKDHPTICWASTEEDVVDWLDVLAGGYTWNLHRGRVSELSRRDSWRNAAIAYAGCYRELAMRKEASAR